MHLHHTGWRITSKQQQRKHHGSLYNVFAALFEISGTGPDIWNDHVLDLCHFPGMYYGGNAWKLHSAGVHIRHVRVGGHFGAFALLQQTERFFSGEPFRPA